MTLPDEDIDYESLHAQLQSQLQSTLNQSNEHFKSFSHLKSQHNVLSSRISSLLNILERIPVPEAPFKKENEDEEEALKIKKRQQLFEKLAKTRPDLRPLLDIITSEGQSYTNEFENLEALRSALQTENDGYYAQLLANAPPHTNDTTWLNDAVGYVEADYNSSGKHIGEKKGRGRGGKRKSAV